MKKQKVDVLKIPHIMYVKHNRLKQRNEDKIKELCLFIGVIENEKNCIDQ